MLAIAFDIAISIIALAVFVTIMYVVGRWTGVIENHQSPFTADSPDEDDDEEEGDDEEDEDDEDEDYDEDDDDEEYITRETELAADITMSRIDWIGKLELRRMLLRAENPHLYVDTWYEDSRREFSLWAVEQAEIAAEDYAREMGKLAA